ncbi:hypothetical protein BDR26DRAFT_851080 [Obelidium mucronatum]|nr:hypothetical protein BDR26DRAFT_851080 [Obelidium mucronatum]
MDKKALGIINSLSRKSPSLVSFLTRVQVSESLDHILIGFDAPLTDSASFNSSPKSQARITADAPEACIALTLAWREQVLLTRCGRTAIQAVSVEISNSGSHPVREEAFGCRRVIGTSVPCRGRIVSKFGPTKVWRQFNRVVCLVPGFKYERVPADANCMLQKRSVQKTSVAPARAIFRFWMKNKATQRQLGLIKLNQTPGTDFVFYSKIVALFRFLLHYYFSTPVNPLFTHRACTWGPSDVCSCCGRIFLRRLDHRRLGELR